VRKCRLVLCATFGGGGIKRRCTCCCCCCCSGGGGGGGGIGIGIGGDRNGERLCSEAIDGGGGGAIGRRDLFVEAIIVVVVVVGCCCCGCGWASIAVNKSSWIGGGGGGGCFVGVNQCRCGGDIIGLGELVPPVTVNNGLVVGKADLDHLDPDIIFFSGSSSLFFSSRNSSDCGEYRSSLSFSS
jgi:hypothetical protein